MKVRGMKNIANILRKINDFNYKDDVLFKISKFANVAQFISFSPGPVPRQRFVRIKSVNSFTKLKAIDEGIKELIKSSPSGLVNIRSFDPHKPKRGIFIYGENDVKSVLTKINDLSRNGYYTIINETIDINDGGVSGVIYGGIIEFAPQDTPKCVDKPGICSMPAEIGIELLKKVYKFKPEIFFPTNVRVEFSIHPLRRGFKNRHTIIWEIERTYGGKYDVKINWPNRFSRFIGDKVFGLLIADLLGFNVPFTTVINRNVGVFTFGKSVGTKEYWLRTAPPEPVPGKYITVFGWRDPFKIMNEQDPEGKEISSMLVQESVDSEFSGAALIDKSNNIIVEGVRGRGDKFMMGLEAPYNKLPENVVATVRANLLKIKSLLGSAKIEWAFNKGLVWILQLHLIHDEHIKYLLIPGNVKKFIKFDISEGIESLRMLIEKLKDTNNGIEIIGNVGICSHYGDLLRRYKIPSFITHKNN